MKKLFASSIFALVLLPQVVFAQGGFVPCDGVAIQGGTACTECHLVQMGNTVLIWLIGILFLIFAFMIFAAGWAFITSGGKPESRDAAKKKLLNAIIGLLIVLAAWLIVDTVMRALLSGGNGQITGYGPWQQVQCGTMAQTQFIQPSGTSIATAQSLSCPQSGTDPTTGAPIYNCTLQMSQCATTYGGVGTTTAGGSAVTCVTPTPSSGGGSCTVPSNTSNACHPSNLTCFNDPNAAAQVCMLESSGGNTSALSGSDLCQDGSSFSVGLWQINLLVNSHLVPGCSTGVFSSASCGTNCQGSCVNRRTNSAGVSYCAMWDCRVVNQAGYNACVAAAQNPSNNTSAACSLYASQGRGAWLTSANACGVNP